MGSGKQPLAVAQRRSSMVPTPALGSGRNGLKRLKHKIFQGRAALNRPTLRRLARRAGVRRINAGVYDEAPTAMRAWLSKIVQDACVFTEHAHRLTVTLNDILLALKRNGVTLYGFNMTERRRRLTQRLPREVLTTAAQRVAARTTPAAAALQQGRRSGSALPAAQAAQLASAGPSTAAAGSRFSPTPERASEIQASLSAFRDTVVARQNSSDAAVPRVLEWVAAHLLGRGRPACSASELEVVLDALAGQDAVMLTRTDGAAKPSTVWFV